MAKDRVHVAGQVARPAAEVWAVLRDFCGAWHPLIETIKAEPGQVRAFTAKGEGTWYRERLTWFSDSERSMGYTHLEGIADCTTYDAMVSVTDTEGGAQVEWTAEVEATAARIGAICEGTAAVFGMGIAALASAPLPAGQTLPLPSAPPALLTLDGPPRLSLLASGGRGKVLALFLHGIGGAKENWAPQVAALGSMMPAAAMDLRGYGGSTLGHAQSTVADHVADILRVKAHFGAEKLLLIGLSYGSWLATSFAMRHADMLAGLVLMGGCTGMSEAGVEEREAFRQSREVPLNAGQTPRDFAPNVVKVLAGPDASDATKQALFDSMAAIPAATYRDALTCFTTPPERFDFSRLNLPVLMMTGEFDRLASPAEIRGVAGRIHRQATRPDVRFEVIARAGHVCNVEDPETVSRHLLTFAGRL